jgi:hypothetical protein
LRFETANPVLIVYDGIISQTDPHRLEMIVDALNQHTQRHLDCFSKNLSIDITPSYFDEQSPECYRISLDVAKFLTILLEKDLTVEN